jgi:hypothetical protein
MPYVTHIYSAGIKLTNGCIINLDVEKTQEQTRHNTWEEKQ